MTEDLRIRIQNIIFKSQFTKYSEHWFCETQTIHS